MPIIALSVAGWTMANAESLIPPGQEGKELKMFDDWWKYLLGSIPGIFGMAIKDARWKAKTSAEILALQEHDKKICVCDIQCLERRKSCNEALRREMDMGEDRFNRIEISITANNTASQIRYEKMMELLMALKK